MLADDYDIDYLQVPKHFADKITVSNSEDIEAKIKWAKENPYEYFYLLKELYSHFVSRFDFVESFQAEEFRYNYFKEFYR